MVNKKNIVSVLIYLQKRRKRQLVGKLSRRNKRFIFTYDHTYLYRGRPISLGPELPLSPKEFSSQSLWPSFIDRIPSKKNPAYSEYSEMAGIDPDESNPLVLLSTLGHKGPSSFIFSPVYESNFSRNDVLCFRKKLKLSVREFSDIFDLSSATINRIEKNKTSGKDALKRLEIYYFFPKVAIYEVKKNGYKISDEKREFVEHVLENEIRSLS